LGAPFVFHTPAGRDIDMLGAIKKQFRNPISHGGFDEQGTLFHFHVPGLSALPALLTSFNVSIERYATPISRAEFERLCGQLDECDGLLEQSVIGPGVRYARMCLPVSFSKDFRDRCRAATQSDEALESAHRRADRGHGPAYKYGLLNFKSKPSVGPKHQRQERASPLTRFY
jgi:hypothetical protein